MISLENVSAANSHAIVHALSLTLGPGVHAFVGRPADGTELLVELLAGERRARTGRIVREGLPTSSCGRRRAIAYVPRAVAFREPIFVEKLLALASATRREPARPACERLEALGVEGLVRRRSDTLTPGEARAVALVEALTSSAVRLVLVDEPLACLDAAACGHAAGAFRRAGERGAVVVVTTASTRDAAELASDLLLFEKGVLKRRLGPADPWASIQASGGARLRVVARPASALLFELARFVDSNAADGSPTAISRVALEGGGIVVEGRDPAELAAVVGEAIVRAKVDVVAMRPERSGLDELRFAAAGNAAGAYYAALDLARKSALAPPIASGEPPPA